MICLLQSHLATVINYPKINNVIHVPRSFMKSSSTVHHDSPNAPTFTGRHDNKRETREAQIQERNLILSFFSFLRSPKDWIYTS